MLIHPAIDFDTDRAINDFRCSGIVAIDDVSGELIDVLFDEFLTCLEHEADVLDIRNEPYPTPYGTVYLIRNADRITKKDAIKRVRAELRLS